MSLGYPSVKEYKWVIQSNQIKDCIVMVHDIDVSHNIWDKSVPSLKVKSTRRKPTPAEGDLVQVPEELSKLNKDIYLTADMFFVNGIPFFLAPSRKI